MVKVLWLCLKNILSIYRNDILRSKGIIPEKPPDPEPIIQQALLEAHQRAHENRLEDKTLGELDDLEDLEDDAFLDTYRQQRLAELSSLQKKSLHGQVYPISKPDYARDVTEASSKFPVLVNLTSGMGTNVESRVLTELWRELARKYADVKFCEMRADLCIEGYPERNCPTILAYKDGDIRRQIVTLRELQGIRTSLKDLEVLLVDVGAIEEKDMRLREDDGDEEAEANGRRGLQGQKVSVQDDEDDWD